MRGKVLLFVVFRSAPHYKKRFKIFFLFYIATLAKNHIFQFLPFRSYRVVKWCSGVLSTLRCLRNLQGVCTYSATLRPCILLRTLWLPFPLIALRGIASLFFLAKKLPHSAYLACHCSGLIPCFFSSASAPLLPYFLGFPFHFRALVTPLRFASHTTGNPSARYSAHPPTQRPHLLAPQTARLF